jgi:hypothetical protein
MGWHHMNGWNWMWMVTMFVVFLGVVATLVTMSLRRSSAGAEPGPTTAETPCDSDSLVMRSMNNKGGHQDNTDHGREHNQSPHTHAAEASHR